MLQFQALTFYFLCCFILLLSLLFESYLTAIGMCSSMTNFTEESCLPPIVKSFGHIEAPSLNLLAQTDIIILQQSAASLMVLGVYTLAAKT